jgi:hypothetical protein
MRRSARCVLSLLGEGITYSPDRIVVENAQGDL